MKSYKDFKLCKGITKDMLWDYLRKEHDMCENDSITVMDMSVHGEVHEMMSVQYTLDEKVVFHLHHYDNVIDNFFDFDNLIKKGFIKEV